MRRSLFTTVSLALCCCFVTGCPERDEVVDQVGGQPGRQMQDVRERVGRVEQKTAAQTNEAAKAGE